MSLELFTDEYQVVPGLLPVDLATANNTGKFVSAKNYHTAAILFIKKAGTNGEDHVLTLNQATTVAGASKKALVFDRYQYKVAADITTVGIFTRVTNNALSTLTVAGVTQAMVIIDVPLRQMDIAGGFDCFSLDVSAPGSTAGALGTYFYLLGEARFDQSIQLTAIAD